MLEVILTLNLKINIIYLTKIVGFLVDMLLMVILEKIKEKIKKTEKTEKTEKTVINISVFYQ